MGFQTTYNLNPAAAVEGMLADSGDNDVLSRLLTVAAQAGVAVVWKTPDKDSQVRPPDATGQITGPNLQGVVIYDPAAVNAPNAIGDSVSVLKRGRIWVFTEEAVTLSDQPFIRFAAGGGGAVLGRFRKSADTATAVGVPNGCMKFLTTTTGSGLVLLEVNVP